MTMIPTYDTGARTMPLSMTVCEPERAVTGDALEEQVLPGSGLNVPVVAEGVERTEELEFLKSEICQSAQGYLLSRPKDISNFRAITEGRSRVLDAERPELRLVS